MLINHIAGEIMVWDTGRDDDTLIASSGLGDDSHKEPVSRVTWVPDSNGKYNVSAEIVAGKS